MLHLQRLGNQAWAIGVALLVSTWIGLIATAIGTTMWLLRRGQAASPAHDATLHQTD